MNKETERQVDKKRLFEVVNPVSKKSFSMEEDPLESLLNEFSEYEDDWDDFDDLEEANTASNQIQLSILKAEDTLKNIEEATLRLKYYLDEIDSYVGHM